MVSAGAATAAAEKQTSEASKASATVYAREVCWQKLQSFLEDLCLDEAEEEEVAPLPFLPFASFG